MTDIVTITSQGQVTIPARFRRQLGLQKKSKAIVFIKDDQLIIKPEVDILELEGSLSHLAKKFKGKSIDEIIAIEEAAMGETVARDYRKKFLPKTPRKKWKVTF